MKHFFAKLIILALVLTAPLSFTGDRCPDFKPDCVRSTYAEKTRAVAVAQQRIAPAKSPSSHTVPIKVTATPVYNEPAYFKPTGQFLKEQFHERAPPHALTASV